MPIKDSFYYLIRLSLAGGLLYHGVRKRIEHWVSVPASKTCNKYFPVGRALLQLSTSLIMYFGNIPSDNHPLYKISRTITAIGIAENFIVAHPERLCPFHFYKPSQAVTESNGNQVDYEEYMSLKRNRAIVGGAARQNQNRSMNACIWVSNCASGIPNTWKQ